MSYPVDDLKIAIYILEEKQKRAKEEAEGYDTALKEMRKELKEREGV